MFSKSNGFNELNLDPGLGERKKWAGKRGIESKVEVARKTISYAWNRRTSLYLVGNDQQSHRGEGSCLGGSHIGFCCLLVCNFGFRRTKVLWKFTT